MDLTGVEIKPARGMVALKFIDDVDGDGDLEQGDDADHDGLIAIVVAIGPEVKSAKKGATVVTNEWARDGLKLGDGIVLVNEWDIVATLAT